MYLRRLSNSFIALMVPELNRADSEGGTCVSCMFLLLSAQFSFLFFLTHRNLDSLCCTPETQINYNLIITLKNKLETLSKSLPISLHFLASLFQPYPVPSLQVLGHCNSFTIKSSAQRAFPSAEHWRISDLKTGSSLGGFLINDNRLISMSLSLPFNRILWQILYFNSKE